MSGPMKTVLIYFAAALAEIAGCFAFWAWFRLDKSVFWLAPGMLSLAAFAWLLALSPPIRRAAPMQSTVAFTSYRPCCGYGA